MQKKWSQKQIPTMLGIGVLIVALVVGMIVLPRVTNFAPRATPETTPKNAQLSNVKDTSFTVSFLTDEATTGFLKYGTSADKMNLQASDDRDQLAGTVGQYTTHYITLRDLSPDTQYYYVLGTASVPKFDNGGTPFMVKTTKRGGSPTSAKTIYGNVVNASNNPADGSLVFVTIDGVSMLSSLVKNSGSWAIPLSTARVIDGSSYAQVTDTTPMKIFVQGPQVSSTTSFDTTVGEAQPVKSLTLDGGATQNAMVTTQTSLVDETQATAAAVVTESVLASPSILPAPVEIATQNPDVAVVSPLSGLLADTASSSGELAATPAAVTVDMSATAKPVVETTQPTIVGSAPANTLITVEVHSENQITTQLKTDANGNYTFDLSEAEKQLEPGEHTVTVTYVDPVTGQQKTETKTFTVAPKATAATTTASDATTAAANSLLAAANTGAVPYGSGNPYVVTPSTSAVPVSTIPAQVVMPATTSALPQSGSVGTTYALIAGGIFLILAGLWSYRQATLAVAEGDENDSDVE